MRGIKKWQPFKSLNGQYQILDERRKQKRKKDKPELSENQIEDINALLTSLTKGDYICVTYYDDGEIIQEKDLFLQIDPYEKRICLTKHILPFDALLDLKRV